MCLLFFLKTKKLDWLIRSFLANCPNIIFQKTFLDEYHLLLHRKFLAKQLRLPTFSLDYYTWKSFCCGVSSKDFWSFPRKKDDSMLTVATDVVDVDIGVSRGNLSSDATVTLVQKDPQNSETSQNTILNERYRSCKQSG